MSWSRIEDPAWEAVAAHLPRPWPQQVCLHDLRWWVGRARASRGRLRLPGRAALALRWGVTDWQVRVLLRQRDRWEDPWWRDPAPPATPPASPPSGVDAPLNAPPDPPGPRPDAPAPSAVPTVRSSAPSAPPVLSPTAPPSPPVPPSPPSRPPPAPAHAPRSARHPQPADPPPARRQPAASLPPTCRQPAQPQTCISSTILPVHDQPAASPPPENRHARSMLTDPPIHRSTDPTLSPPSPSPQQPDTGAPAQATPAPETPAPARPERERRPGHPPPEPVLPGPMVAMLGADLTGRLVAAGISGVEALHQLTGRQLRMLPGIGEGRAAAISVRLSSAGQTLAAAYVPVPVKRRTFALGS